MRETAMATAPTSSPDLALLEAALAYYAEHSPATAGDLMRGSAAFEDLCHGDAEAMTGVLVGRGLVRQCGVRAGVPVFERTQPDSDPPKKKPGREAAPKAAPAERPAATARTATPDRRPENQPPATKAKRKPTLTEQVSTPTRDKASAEIERQEPPGGAASVPPRREAEDDTEVWVLGAALVDGDDGSTVAADLIVRELQDEDFRRSPHRLIFQAIESLRDRDERTDPVSVAAEMEKAGDLDRTGGRDYLAWIVDRVPTGANVATHVRLLQEAAARRCEARFRERYARRIADGKEPVADVLADGLEEWRGVARTRLVAPTLAELLMNPSLTEPPKPVVPKLAYEGRVSMLAAREKDGKSTLAGAAAAAVSSGSSFLGETVTAGLVLNVSLDEHLGDTVRRLPRFGANADRIRIVDRLDGRPVETLAALVIEYRPALVLIDSLEKFSALFGVKDPSDSAQWVPLMAGIARIARDSGAAILLLHHAKKADSTYRDSTAIGSGVDAILEMSGVIDDPTARAVRCRARWSMSPFTVRLTGDLDDSGSRLAYELATGDLALGVRVFLFIEAHPGCSARQLYEGVSGRGEEIRRERDALLSRGAIENRGDGGKDAYYATAAGDRDARSEATDEGSRND
ncbi:MAG: DnaB-like helicase N-terminal domain-containing protein [Gemmatimonadota bacterium]